MNNSLHAVIYSRRTGRVRRVIRAGEQTSAEQLLVNANPVPGEAVHIMWGGGLHEWQAAAAVKAGVVPKSLHPDVHSFVHTAAAAAGIALNQVEDRHEVIDDATGEVVSEVTADLACGDSLPGRSLRLKP